MLEVPMLAQDFAFRRTAYHNRSLRGQKGGGFSRSACLADGGIRLSAGHVLRWLVVVWLAGQPLDPVCAQQVLRFGHTVESTIDLTVESWRTFQVKVPRDALVLTLTIEDSPVDIDLYAKHNSQITDWSVDAEHIADSNRYNDVLRISRNSIPPLRHGVYYVDVAYILDTPPMVGKRRLEQIPFKITATILRHRVDAELVPGERLQSNTTPEEGYFRTFLIDVPEEAETLRIDLDDVTRDMDIAARYQYQITDVVDIEHRAISLLGRETLIIDRESDPPLQPGVWFINVFDPVEQGTVPFAIYAGFTAEAPEALLEIPQIPLDEVGLARALRATVEITCPDAAGSGTLVSPDGLILTNHHVVESASGRVAGDGEIVVSLTFDERQPPMELFRGRVLEYDVDRDLALLEITSGLYFQPIPDSYTFPFLELGDANSLRIGSPLQVMGYPITGGTGSRVSVTYTAGVVSGFEAADFGTIIKTDASISSGNSGGAAMDAEFRLIGLPTAVVPEPGGNGQVGYIHPVDAIPESWREIIRQRLPASLSVSSE